MNLSAPYMAADSSTSENNWVVPVTHIQPPISKEDKAELVVRYIFNTKLTVNLIIITQGIARQIWLELVVGCNNTQLPLPHNEKKSTSPHTSPDGEELMTPDWKLKVNITNKHLIEIVKDRIKSLPVGTFHLDLDIYTLLTVLVIIAGCHIDLSHRQQYSCCSWNISWSDA